MNVECIGPVWNDKPIAVCINNIPPVDFRLLKTLIKTDFQIEFLPLQPG